MWTDKGNIVGPFQTHFKILIEAGLTPDEILSLQNMWNESHRVYHNIDHLNEILLLIDNQYPIINEDKKILILAAFFHDAVYNTKSQTNEEDSAKLMMSMCRNLKVDVQYKIWNIILETKDHTKKPSSDLSAKFLEFDLHNMIHGSLTKMISNEKKIMREFGFVDYHTYKNVRGTKFLEKLIPHVMSINPQSKAESYLDWYKNYTPKIAIYAGSFFPMHLGHYEILKKAERIFDKVIILMGENSSKDIDTEERLQYFDSLKKKLPNNEIIYYKGMLHNHIKNLSYPVTLIKGLRNPSDFDNEKLQLRYMEDMLPDINVMYIVSDRKYEHVSSSAIKSIQKINPDEAERYLL